MKGYASELSSKRGDDLIKEANDRLGSWSLFGFGKQEKHHDAAERFKMAANAYKVAQAWPKSGDAFLAASENFKIAGDEELEVLSCLEEAGQAFKKDRLSNDKAVLAFRQAIEIFNLKGRFTRSIKCYEAMAEIYEGEDNFDNALTIHEQIAVLSLNDNKPSAASKAHLKMASILSEKMEEFERAGQIFKQVGDQSLESNLGKYAAKGYFFQYLLCLVAIGDNVSVQIALEHCIGADYSFSSSRECLFVIRINQACIDQDSQEYAQACMEFDNITPLDPWKTSMLTKGKLHLPAVEDGAASGAGAAGGGGEDYVEPENVDADTADGDDGLM